MRKINLKRMAWVKFEQDAAWSIAGARAGSKLPYYVNFRTGDYVPRHGMGWPAKLSR